MATGSSDSIGSVLIDGFYGYRNAGDEAILASLIRRIRSYDPDAHVTVSTADPPYTSALHDVDACVPRYDPADGVPSREWLEAIRSVDQLWIGGGGLFGDRKLLRYAIPTAIARTTGSRVATAAVGSGPFSADGNRLARPMGAHIDSITVRDERTARFLRDVGVTDPITVLADPVFGYEFDGTGTSLPASLEEVVGPDTIVVSVCDPVTRPVDAQELANALATISATRDVHVLFLPFHAQRESAASDIDVSRRIAQLHDDLDATVWETELTFRQLLAAIGQSRLVLGMRLHSVIFAAVTDTPFVGFPYAPKCVTHLEQLHATTAFPCNDIDENALVTEILDTMRRGIPSQTADAIATHEKAAAKIVPTIQSTASECSATRLPHLCFQIGIDGMGRLLPTDYSGI